MSLSNTAQSLNGSPLNGTIAAVRNNNGKCSIVWRFEAREVWIAERAEAGPKRALYEFFRAVPRDAAKKIWRCEADAEHVVAARIEADYLEAERLLDEIDSFPVVIESDPYIALDVA